MTHNAPSSVAAADELSLTEPTSIAGAILGSPVLWGGTATCLFYAAIPHLPFGRDKLTRYFCSHPLEYALVALFCIGLAILTKRMFNLLREWSALKGTLLTDQGSDSLEGRVELFQQHLKKAPIRLRESMLFTRLRETCDYVKSSHSARGLEAHLKHLSETAADRLHDSYSLLLTINWAVPILGFLGTVIGITLAIANVTPDQLDTSLNSVTGGLAVAFDTTTVAMSFSLVLVFAYDWIKRSEQKILTRVDDVALRDVLPYFVAGTTDADPLSQAQADAALQLMERTESLVQEQTLLWRESVDGLRERWSETLIDQQQHLAEGLNAGVDSTLGIHAAQLEQVRQEFLAAFELATGHFTTALEQDRQSREDREVTSQQQFEQIWQRVSDDLQTVIRSHDAHAEDVVDRLMDRVQQWQAGLELGTQAVETQLGKLQELTDTMLRVADQEDHLLRVERQLNQNLESVRAAETFEQTLHNLTAAVHLLTARANSRAA